MELTLFHKHLVTYLHLLLVDICKLSWAHMVNGSWCVLTFTYMCNTPMQDYCFMMGIRAIKGSPNNNKQQPIMHLEHGSYQN